MRIVIGSDHAGFFLKEKIKKWLMKRGYEVVDVGTSSLDSVDYPEYAAKVASMVSEGKVRRGILICGTGIGMSIVANKFPRVRAALCLNEKMAEMARRHNNSNILCLGGRILSSRKALKIVDVWLSTGFDDGRHLRRIRKIRKIEKEIFGPS